MLHQCREQTLSFVQLPGQVPSTLESHPHDLSRIVTTSEEEVSQGLVAHATNKQQAFWKKTSQSVQKEI